ncbi:uncharacterized protein LOC110983925 [Acanthaster planci]|uniref:Uncharacterized protein LOC110983925 n=1 Tax=Acanthaster planci TaxID=133434 RepID=A0A8B7Z112_ACAPL|nr:uncharacterized protein LOC110983925 [Acanthaster planci]
MSHCCVPMCVNDSRYSKEFSFHNFPKDEKQRSLWIQNIRREPGVHFKITRNTYVCSEHFKPDDFKRTLTGIRILKPGVAPTVFPWTGGVLEGRRPTCSLRKECSTISVQDEVSIDVGQISCTVAPLNKLLDHDYLEVRDPEQHLQAANARIKELQQQLDWLRRPERYFLERFSNDPAKLQFYTGFQTHAMFMAFFQCVLPHASSLAQWGQTVTRLLGEGLSQQRRGSQCQLSLFDQFFLFLNKVKLGSFDEDLADKYGISPSAVTMLTITWANFLYDLLGSVCLWPTREKVSRLLPDAFKLCPKTRVILDCTELTIQTPFPANVNQKLCPSVKRCSTVTCKGLVGISPGGFVTFVSGLYDGGTSGEDVTEDCGILDLLEPGDEVIADTGLGIGDLLIEIDCALVDMPLSSAQRNEDSDHTCLSDHIERITQRVKQFHLLDRPLPKSLADVANELWTVCCLLPNFQGPLI